MLQRLFLTSEQQMATKIKEIREKFSQSSDKGTSSEEVFRMFLQEYLPRRLEVGHGEIVDRNNNRSGQTDVVVANEDHPFTFTLDKPGLFFIEGVSAAGEVKTTLNSAHLKKSIELSRKFKALRISPGEGTTIYTNRSDSERYYNCPPYFLFAFDSTLSLLTIIKTINAAEPNFKAKPYPCIDAVFILQKGWAINFGDGEGGFRYSTPDGRSIPGWLCQTKGSALFECLGWLSAVMPRMVRYENVILGYMIPKVNVTSP